MSEACQSKSGPVILKTLSVTFTIFIVGYIMIPVLITLVMSFNDAAMIRFPISAGHCDGIKTSSRVGSGPTR
jgi:ABC-type spermidine/putrescine transport system permease subunit II